MLSIHLKFGSSSLKGLGGVRSVTEIFISKKCGQTDGQILNHLLVHRFYQNLKTGHFSYLN